MLFITGTINAYKERDVATCDLPGAFLHTLTDEHVIMVLRRELAKLMIKLDPKMYMKYITMMKSGQPILYIKLFTSVYGLLRSALLWGTINGVMAC